ncbi:DsbE family thiol:disulfide interchange protein [Neptunomonas antarctica]|uniref:Cytochrome c biogenesis protein CcmG, thiol:disulfide interchange protein DsbE n=1 Tax=Neptunomonas antarctica TaxID=619304 RepID=A0A1N7JD18_9GAMM|nr:DsbE family thiol:disulfide interchange protein [Neptunomonas antarctica]SIS47164.1 cytochrome c biogenesis protein CcmG, thiol:disulfide interchange protein DsbE [Neptunomonas antarctica]
MGINMRRFFLFIPLIIFLVIGALFWQGLKLNPTDLPSALIDKPVPDFSLPALQDDARAITQDDLKGEPALLNVWATWCPTCKQEHAQLNKIAREENVVIYGINYKDERAAATEWLRRYRNPYVLNVFDKDGTLGLDLGVYGAPETYVLDAQGVIRYKHVGAVNEKVWAELRKILQQVSADSQG